MGKSPGKWLKTLLFSKKSKRKDSLRNSSEKGYVNNITSSNKGKDISLGDNSPIISEPVLVNTYNNSVSTVPVLEEANSVVPETMNVNMNPVYENKLDLREIQAATKAQAAFRGFLARRAFRALKGIIKLQGLVRGYLVRRQAISTLYAMNGIIKLQALVRGRIIRASKNINLKINYSNIFPQNSMGCDSEYVLKDNFSKNSFGYKLIFSEIGFKPLEIQYEKTDQNSVLNWLERWEKTQFWKPVPNPNSKSKKLNSAPNQTQSLKAKKQNSKKNQSLNNSDQEKCSKNPRRLSLSPSSGENPKCKFENPKKLTRKVSNSMSESEIGKLSSDLKKTLVNNNNNNSSIENASKTVLEITPTEQSLCSIGESSNKSINRRSSLSVKTTLKTVPSEGNGESSNDKSDNKRSSFSSKTVPKDENLLSNGESSSNKPNNKSSVSAKPALKTVPSEENLSTNGESSNNNKSNNKSSISTIPALKTVPSEEENLSINGESSNNNKSNNKSSISTKPSLKTVPSDENLSNGESSYKKSSNRSRRSSFSSGLEIPETESRGASRSVPSYMASTESAKARIKSQVSVSPDSVSELGKNGILRRHSLPSGKIKSVSPRNRKLVQSGTKGGVSANTEWKR